MNPYFNNLIGLALSLIGFALIVFSLQRIERYSARRIAHRLGWKGILWTGWIGVVLHELSHLFFASIFGHRIIAWKLFDPDPVTQTLGYVRHHHKKNTAFQNIGYFASGIGPLVFGIFALIIILTTIISPHILWSIISQNLKSPTTIEYYHLFDSPFRFAHALFQAIIQHASPLLPLQLYLMVCIISHMAPSHADLKIARKGIGVALILLFALSMYFQWLVGISLGALLFSLLPSLLALLLITLLFQLIFIGIVNQLTN